MVERGFLRDGTACSPIAFGPVRVPSWGGIEDRVVLFPSWRAGGGASGFGAKRASAQGCCAGCGVAELPTGIRLVEGRLQPPADVGDRRHLAACLRRPARPSRHRGRPGLGRRGRLHHRPCPSARRRGPSKGAPDSEPHGRALGRSRGGLTTKIHLAADGRCRPLAFHLTAGQAGDGPAFTQLMTVIRVERPRGRPRTSRGCLPAVLWRTFFQLMWGPRAAAPERIGRATSG